MADKFQNKYRIGSFRLPGWDYSIIGMYFITICTCNRAYYFGDIFDGIMHLSEIGKIAQIEWLKTFDMRPDMNLHLDEFVVMPDHFHAIIGIGINPYNQNDRKCRIAMHCDSTDHVTNSYKNQFGPQRKNLASIIRGFKIGVTKNARMINPEFAWQPNYHDHIIRNLTEYYRIQQYIIHNPAKWKGDTE